MPRLTDELYHQNYLRLQQLWQDHPITFSILPTNLQWDLHAFYLPNEDLTRDELLDHRRLITKQYPNLPARAGRACERVLAAHIIAEQYASGDEISYNQVIARLVSRSAKTKARHRGRTSSVFATVNPEPDFRFWLERC